MTVIFKNKEQLAYLKSEVHFGKSLMLAAVHEYDMSGENGHLPNVAVVTIQTWSCLKMVEVFVTDQIEQGNVTIDKSFFKKSFSFPESKNPDMPRGEYPEGLYHVVKYAAFIDGRGFIDEMGTISGAVDAAMEILEIFTFED